MILFSELSKITPGKILQLKIDGAITQLLLDSRKKALSGGTLFFAISGNRHNGHQFIPSLYQAGIRNFVIEKELDISTMSDANFFLARTATRTLQDVVVHHRKKFSIPIVGITGSNGKTIVKEWLFQLLSIDHRVVKNPGSYNSQIGVPLSVWALQKFHQIGIFEAGISEVGEMANLQPIIQPTIGLITNLGSAHDAGFKNRLEKLNEKLKLFTAVNAIIYCQDHKLIAEQIQIKFEKSKRFSWGVSPESSLRISFNDTDAVTVQFLSKSHDYFLTGADESSRENVLHCMAVMYYLRYNPAEIQKGINSLRAVSMRLEIKKGINESILVDDSYNNDLAGLEMSLNFLMSLPRKDKSLILSDILQSGLSEDVLALSIKKIIESKDIKSLFGIGPILYSQQHQFDGLNFESSFYSSTSAFIDTVSDDMIKKEAILIKGARHFEFEKIAKRLQEKIHGTVLEIDLNAIVQNLNFFKRQLKPGVKVMAMVKAFAYGGGSEEVAAILQYNQIDYLGVAYADEGVQLRKANITVPIMVMNPSPESFETLMEYSLEPEIYNQNLLNKWMTFVGDQVSIIHLKIETGMNRLGFGLDELEGLLTSLKERKNLKIGSIFSHLAGADDAAHDPFTLHQADTFNNVALRFEKELGLKTIKHLLNTAGILRFPDLQFDMVRLGIGLYGVSPVKDIKSDLLPVFTLKTTVSQIKSVTPGATIGYNRKGRSDKKMDIATLAIGYADGYSRAYSNGKGSFRINGNLVPVIGNVCMDMTMVDVTGIDVSEGDEAIVYGDGLDVAEVASWIGTIPYELLTNTSERVKRVFHMEGI